VYAGSAGLSPSNATSAITYTSTAADCEATAALNTTQRGTLSHAATAGLLVNKGFAMRIPARAATQTLRIYWGNGVNTSGVVTITATLDDGTTHSTTHTYDVANVWRCTTVTFAGAGQSLDVSVICTTQPATSGSIAFVAVTLA